MGLKLFHYSKRGGDFVLGVDSVGENATVVLRKKDTPLRYILWNFDEDTGAIKLNSSGFAITADSIASDSALFLGAYTGKSGQQWEHLHNPGSIFSVKAPEIGFHSKGSDASPVILTTLALNKSEWFAASGQNIQAA